MPIETKQAVEWAMLQEGVIYQSELSNHDLVEKVREYFNTNEIVYTSFSFSDLQDYL